MTTDALLPHVGAKDPLDRAARVAIAKRRLEDNTVVRPDETRSATFVFNRGMNRDEVIGFASRHDLTVIGFHLKAPLDDEGHILSVGVGMDDFFAIQGDSEERFDYAINLQRARIQDLARGYSESPLEQDQEKGQGYQRIAEEGLGIFTMDAFGSSRSLSEAANEQDIAGVFLDGSNSKIREFEARSNRQ